jgi:hypothetical protein
MWVNSVLVIGVAEGGVLESMYGLWLSLWATLNDVTTLLVVLSLGFIWLLARRMRLALKSTAQEIAGCAGDQARLQELFASDRTEIRAGSRSPQGIAETVVERSFAELKQRWHYDERKKRFRRLGSSVEVLGIDHVAEATRVWFGIPYGVIDLLPGVATGLGILGTFLGITFGLSQIEVGSDDVKKSVGAVVEGLGTAFWTSIFGVVASICLSWRTRVVESEAADAVQRATRDLDRWLERGAPASALDVFRRELREDLQVATFDGLRDKLESSGLRADLRRLVEQQTRQLKLADRQAQAAEASRLALEDGHNTLQAFGDELIHKLVPKLDGVFVNALAPMQRVVQEVANAGVNSAKEFVTEMVGRLETGLTGTFDNVQASLSAFQTTFNGLTERLEGAAVKQLAVLEEGEKAALRLRDRLGELEQLVDHAAQFEASTRALAAQQLELQTALGSSVDRLGARMQQTGADVSGNVAALGALLGETVERFGALREVTTAIEGAIGKASSDALVVSERLLKRLDSEERLVAGHAEAAKQLHAATQGLAPSLAAVGPVVASLAGLGERQEALERMRRQAEEQLLQASTVLAHGLEASSSAMANQADGVSDAVNALRQAFGEMGQVSATVGQHLRGAVERLDEVAGRLTDRLGREEALLGGYGKATGELTHALSLIGPGLGPIVTGLGEATAAQQALAAKLAGTPARVEELVRALGERFGGVDAAARAMDGVASDAERWSRALSEAFNAYQRDLNASLKDTLRQYDGSLAAAVKSIGALLGELEEAIEGVTAANKARAAAERGS